MLRVHLLVMENSDADKPVQNLFSMDPSVTATARVDESRYNSACYTGQQHQKVNAVADKRLALGHGGRNAL